jgi:DNA helicase-2/ATP-dependent DNA helicase PcrA
VPISHARTPEGEAEERRLLHVAVTRAEDVLRLTWARERTLRERVVTRRPSPYLGVLADAIAALHDAARPVDPQPGLERARRALVGAAGTDAHLALLHALQEWRAAAARGAGVPPAVVLSDRILSEVAHRRPTDAGALAAVRGVGPLILDAHGADLVRIVREQSVVAGRGARP